MLQDIQNIPGNLQISLSLSVLKYNNGFTGTPHYIGKFFKLKRVSYPTMKPYMPKFHSLLQQIRLRLNPC